MLKKQEKGILIGVFSVLLLIQTAALASLGSSAEAHLAFSIFLFSLFASIAFFRPKGYAPYFLHPFIVLSATYLLYYWLAPLLYAVFPPEESSYVFSFAPDDSIVPLGLALTSYSGFAVSAYLINIALRPAYLRHEQLREATRNVRVGPLLVGYCLLVALKAHFYSSGWINSLVGLEEAPAGPFYFKLLGPFIPMGLLLFSALLFLTKQGSRLYYFSLLVCIADVGVGVAMGDRRILLGYLFAIVSLNYYKGTLSLRPRKLVLAGALLLLYFGLATKVNDELDNKVLYGKDITYFQVLTDGVREFLRDPFYGYSQSLAIVTTFAQTQMLDAAITARSFGYTYEISPLSVFFSGAVPGAVSLGISVKDGNYLQLPMYENALTYQASPNLTNPLPAEHFVHAGWSGVFFASILSGAILMLLFKVSAASFPIWLWYWGFFYSNSMGFAMSLTRDVTYSLKALFFVVLVSLLFKLLRRGSFPASA